MKKLLFVCGILFFPFLLKGQSDSLSLNHTNVLDSVIISGNRATSRTPVTYTTLSQGEIKKISPNTSLPLMLNFQPSVVSTSEAGSGLGYTRLSVRGSDATRINVTLNGVAINDAESQEVFWVNIPSLPSFLESVQLQRGIGTSANGPGAFGASINMQTLFTAPRPYGEADVSYGFYNTAIASIGAGTGLMKNGLSFDIKYNHSSTDGYIRNGKADLNSLFASFGLLKGTNAFKINYIFGDQHTGITWEGIPREMLAVDRRYNPAGEYYDAAGNVRYYDNETDNYRQHFVQAFYSHQFAYGLLWSNTFNYTNGYGYYENYKDDKKLSDYGLAPQVVDGESHKRSDVIIRQLMDNNYYVATSTLKYNSANIRSSLGVNYSYYDGKHYGRMIWSEWNENIPTDYSWYDNTGVKWETGVYARGEFDVDRWTFYADLQYRHIDLTMKGIDKDFANLDYRMKYDFFNPKAGINFLLNKQNVFYVSYAMGHKEPSRSDIKESIKSGSAERIKAEMMHDIELGYKYQSAKLLLGVNFYFMEYKNQLVATGKISDVGYEIKENVPYSYRRGLELSTGWQIIKMLRLDANISLSLNKIKNYTAWLDTYDNPTDWNSLPQTSQQYSTTNLTMSPSIVGMAMLTLTPFQNASLSINGKYVGKQYYDNTSSEERSLPGYFVMCGNASYSLPLKRLWGDLSPRIVFSIYVDNILNNKYISNAWVYRAVFADGSEPYIEEGFFPQATINCIGKIALVF